MEVLSNRRLSEEEDKKCRNGFHKLRPNVKLSHPERVNEFAW